MIHQIVILGGGVGGTLLANVLARRLKTDEAQIVVIDTDGIHAYQPGWLYLPFDEEKPENLVRPERHLLDDRVHLALGQATKIVPERHLIELADGSAVPYDILVLSTGAEIAPDAVPGYAEGAHHFYSEAAALNLHDQLESFQGGKLVVGVADIPYKCPPAPLEFVFKVEEYLQKRGVRERTEITYLSPINRAFTIESVSEFVTPLLAERGIALETFFNTEQIDPIGKKIISLEGTEIDYDLLVLVPPHRGAAVIRDSGLGDAQGWIPTDRSTLEVKGHSNIYAIGDATDIPVSKSGSAAHFEAKVLSDRIVARIRGEPEEEHIYDGRVLCFLETGHGQASQLVFDFAHPPKPPEPNAFYHYEKLLFNRVYWYIVPNGFV